MMKMTKIYQQVTVIEHEAYALQVFRVVEVPLTSLTCSKKEEKAYPYKKNT